MYLLVIGVVLTLIGALMSTRGNTSKFNPPSGGGSRIPPESQVRLNETIQTITGTKETYDEYYKTSNSFSPGKLGTIFLISGIIFIILSYVL